MVAWLEPLNLQTLIVNVFAGDAIYFIVIGLIAILALAAFFRMTMLMTFLFIGLFLFMFSGTEMNYLVIFFTLIAALVIGFVASKIKER